MSPIKQKLNRTKNQDKSEDAGRSNGFQKTYIHSMINPVFVYGFVGRAIPPRHVGVKCDQKSGRS